VFQAATFVQPGADFSDTV